MKHSEVFRRITDLKKASGLEGVKKMRTQNRGFTLLEVMISLVILAVGLLGLAQLTLISRAGLISSQGMTEATTIAQSKLEELRAVTWDEIQAGQDTVTGSTGISFERTWGITTDNNRKMITCLMAWTDKFPRRIQFNYWLTDVMAASGS